MKFPNSRCVVNKYLFFELLAKSCIDLFGARHWNAAHVSPRPHSPCTEFAAFAIHFYNLYLHVLVCKQRRKTKLIACKETNKKAKQNRPETQKDSSRLCALINRINTSGTCMCKSSYQHRLWSEPNVCVSVFLLSLSAPLALRL